MPIAYWKKRDRMFIQKDNEWAKIILKDNTVIEGIIHTEEYYSSKNFSIISREVLNSIMSKNSIIKKETKLKKEEGDKVKIYQKWMTEEDYEGEAILIKCIRKIVNENKEVWMVRFVGEWRVYKRSILVEKEDTTCHQ